MNLFPAHSPCGIRIIWPLLIWNFRLSPNQTSTVPWRTEYLCKYREEICMRSSKFQFSHRNRRRNFVIVWSRTYDVSPTVGHHFPLGVRRHAHETPRILLASRLTKSRIRNAVFGPVTKETVQFFCGGTNKNRKQQNKIVKMLVGMERTVDYKAYELCLVHPQRVERWTASVRLQPTRGPAGETGVKFDWIRRKRENLH